MSLLTLLRNAATSAYLSDTFTGSNGAAWDSSKWTMQGGTQTIQGNRGEMVTPGGYGQAIVDALGIPADFAFTSQYQFTATTNYFTFEYRDGVYKLGMDFGGGQVLWYDNGTLVGYAGGQTVSTSDVVNFRMEVSGTSHKFRYWLNSDPEPSTWLFNYTSTSSTSAGTVPLRLLLQDSGVGTAYIDNVTVAAVGGAPNTVTRTASGSGAGTATTTSATTRIRTASGAGTGTATATGAVTITITRTASGAGTGTATTVGVVSRIRTASGAGAGAATATSFATRIRTASGSGVGGSSMTPAPVEPTGVGGGSEFSLPRRRRTEPAPVVSLIRDDTEAIALVLLLL